MVAEMYHMTPCLSIQARKGPTTAPQTRTGRRRARQQRASTPPSPPMSRARQWAPVERTPPCAAPSRGARVHTMPWSDLQSTGERETGCRARASNAKRPPHHDAALRTSATWPPRQRRTLQASPPTINIGSASHFAPCQTGRGSRELCPPTIKASRSMDWQRDPKPLRALARRPGPHRDHRLGEDPLEAARDAESRQSRVAKD